MRFFRHFLPALLCAFAVTTASAQQTIDLRINELFIHNVDNYTDEYSRHVPWVEIFNSSYNSVEIAGCYLTNDTTGLASGEGNKNWYKIPKGVPNTNIPQRGFLVFFLDNDPTFGPLHTNFNPLDSNSNNYIALINSNGEELIHFFPFPASLRTDSKQSYGYRIDFHDDAMIEANGQTVQNLDFLKFFTPGSTNNHETTTSKSEYIKAKDEYGIGLAIISMTVVFSVLFLIFLMLKGFNYMNKKFPPKEGGHGHGGHSAPPAPKKEETTIKVSGNANEETIAAIAMALHLHYGAQHDAESGILTFVADANSAWSQKHLAIKRVQKR